MRININSHHIDISDSVKTHILSKFKKIKKHFNQITLIEVTIISERNYIKAEAAIYLSGTNLFADAKNNNIYCSIDDLIGKLDRQIIKHKEKLQGKNHRENLKK